MDSSAAKNRLRVVSLAGFVVFFGSLFVPWGVVEVLRVGGDAPELVAQGVVGWHIHTEIARTTGREILPIWGALIPAAAVLLLAFFSGIKRVWRAVAVTVLNGTVIAAILFVNSWAWGALAAIFTASLVQLAWTVELRKAGQAADKDGQS